VANTVQARKRARQAEVSREHNNGQRSQFRSAIKRVLKAIKAGEKDNAITAFRQAVPVLDSMVNKNILHRHKAARHKSRLNAHIKALG
jgi:small subunit ribosomal protein S20